MHTYTHVSAAQNVVHYARICICKLKFILNIPLHNPPKHPSTRIQPDRSDIDRRVMRTLCGPRKFIHAHALMRYRMPDGSARLGSVRLSDLQSDLGVHASPARLLIIIKLTAMRAQYASNNNARTFRIDCASESLRTFISRHSIT